jgi:hypothetical protein
MSTAGEASSLFGAVEATNDPFALPAQGESDVSGNDPFANIQPTSDVDDIFGNATYDSTPLVAAQNHTTAYPATGHDSGWNGSNSHHYTPNPSQDPYSHTQQNTYSAQTATNGWQGAHGQWSAGDTQQQYGSGVLLLTLKSTLVLKLTRCSEWYLFKPLLFPELSNK